MCLRVFMHTFGATRLVRKILDKHTEGIMSEVAYFCERNGTQVKDVYEHRWITTSDGMYSKVFVVILGNGAAMDVVSKYQITEREYFKERLKDG